MNEFIPKDKYSNTNIERDEVEAEEARFETTLKLNLFYDVKDKEVFEQTEVYGKHIGLRQLRQRNALRILLCNLFYSQGDKVRVSRAKKSLGPLRYNPLNIGYRSIISALDALIREEVIIYELGYKDLLTGEGKISTMIIAEKLRRWFKDVGWNYQTVEHLEHEVVVMRNRSLTKDTIDYVDGPHSNWLRKKLREYNNLLNECEIVVVGKDDLIQEEYPDLCLQRKFVSYGIHDPFDGDLLAFGGRMYGPWCNLSSHQRANIEIDGEKTVEVDLVASHINVMYRRETGRPYQGGDPYELCVDGVHIPRHIVKRMATRMQFTKSVQSTTAALEKWYSQKDIPDSRNKKEIKEAEDYISLKMVIKPSKIVRAYLAKHIEIRGYYLYGKEHGYYIQQLESSFVFEIVQQLTAAKIAVLTVYDSFIVQTKYKGYLRHLIDTTKIVNRNKL